MKRINYLFVFVLLFNCLSVTAKTKLSSIVFSSDAPVSISIYDPIDNANNLRIVTATYQLSPDHPITHTVKVEDFSTMYLGYSNGLHLFLLVMEDEKIEVHYSRGKVVVKGANQAGHQYLIDEYSTKGLGFYHDKIIHIVQKYKSSAFNMKMIDKEINDSVLSVFKNDIREMKSKGQITNEFAKVMDQSLVNGYSMLEFYTYMSYFKKRLKERLSYDDSLAVCHRFTHLYNESMRHKNPLGYYYSFPYIGYYEFTYRMMNDGSRSELIKNHDDDTFGEYADLLLAPDCLQKTLLGEVIADAIQKQEDFFDYRKIQSYLITHFPDSEYNKYINLFLKKQEARLNEAVDSSKYVYIDGQSINTFKDLINVDQLKGKRLFVDLWSVFCAPCKVQFQYVEKLHQLLGQFDNLATLYITIDDAEEESRWRSDILYFQLPGYHLMANKSLYNDLSKLLYQGGPCYIPRYILIDEKGEILHANLPRPEQLDNLEVELKSLLKQ